MAGTVLKPGFRLGNWVVEKQIGEGGFGTVWLVRHSNIPDKIAAAKIPTDTQFLRHLSLETVVQHKLAHPNIVATLDADLDADVPYLIIEYVDGETLRQRLTRDRRISPAEAVRISEQVLSALQCAHEHGVVHRDVTPSNILLAADGTVKVSDFGLGFVAEQTRKSRSVSLSGEAGLQERAVIGKLDYMSPEQKRGERDIDGRGDLYSVARILYEMLTGELPEGAFPPVGQIVRGAPAHLDGVIRRGMSPRKEGRFSSAADFLAALKARGPKATPPVPTPTDARRAEQQEDIPPAVYADLRMARLAFDGGDIARTLRYLRSAGTKEGGLDATLSALARYCQHAGEHGPQDFLADLLALADALTKDRRGTDAFAWLADYWAQVIRERLSGGFADFEHAWQRARHYGHDPEALFALALERAAGSEDNVRGALALARAVLPDRDEPWLLQARHYLARGDFDNAEKAVNQALQRRADSAEAAELFQQIIQAARLLGTWTADLGNGVSMKFALIPAGTFRMGSPASEANRDSDETQHTVKLTNAFYMEVTEVTQAQYEAVMGNNPSHFKGAGNPVETVSWHDATAFCKKMSAKTGKAIRLPTEAEWEYACRAGGTGRFSFGDSANQLGEYAWYDSNSNSRTHPVGGKKPNGWGLYDMHGNVWEWCQDGYAKGYPSTMQTDPTGPASARLRVLRGGSWYYSVRRCRSAYRFGLTPGYVWHDGGFRVVVSASVGLD